MSNQTNSDLLELAGFHQDYWEGTIMAEIIRQDISLSDLESLQAHLKESASLMFEREYSPNEVY